MNQARLRDTGRFQHQQSQSPSTIGPDTSKALLGILDPQNGYARPIRPAGGRSSATDCYTSSMGTSIDMTGLDRIIDIDHDAMTATAMAGVGLGTSIEQLKGLGFKPFVVGITAALAVGVASIGLVTIFGPMISV